MYHYSNKNANLAGYSLVWGFNFFLYYSHWIQILPFHNGTTWLRLTWTLEKSHIHTITPLTNNEEQLATVIIYYLCPLKFCPTITSWQFPFPLILQPILDRFVNMMTSNWKTFSSCKQMLKVVSLTVTIKYPPFIKNPIVDVIWLHGKFHIAALELFHHLYIIY